MSPQVTASPSSITARAVRFGTSLLVIVWLAGCGGDGNDETAGRGGSGTTVARSAPSAPAAQQQQQQQQQVVPTGLLDRAQNRLDALIDDKAGGAERVTSKTLLPAVGDITSVGRIALIDDGRTQAVAIIVENLDESARYAFWVRDQKTRRTRFLGFAPPVEADGRLEALAPFDGEPDELDGLIMTSEEDNQPRSPSQEILVVAID